MELYKIWADVYPRKNNGIVKWGFNQQTVAKHTINASQCSFVQSKSRQTTLLFFYDRITGTIDKGVHVGIAFFIFNKAFDLMT